MMLLVEKMMLLMTTTLMMMLSLAFTSTIHHVTFHFRLLSVVHSNYLPTRIPLEGCPSSTALLGLVFINILWYNWPEAFHFQSTTRLRIPRRLGVGLGVGREGVSTPCLTISLWWLWRLRVRIYNASAQMILPLSNIAVLNTPPSPKHCVIIVSCLWGALIGCYCMASGPTAMTIGPTVLLLRQLPSSLNHTQDSRGICCRVILKIDRISVKMRKRCLRNETPAAWEKWKTSPTRRWRRDAVTLWRWQSTEYEMSTRVKYTRHCSCMVLVDCRKSRRACWR